MTKDVNNEKKVRIINGTNKMLGSRIVLWKDLIDHSILILWRQKSLIDTF